MDVEQTPSKSEPPDLTVPNEDEDKSGFTRSVEESAKLKADEEAAKLKADEEAAKKDQDAQGSNLPLERDESFNEELRPDLTNPQFGGKSSRRIRNKKYGGSSRRPGTVWTDLVKRVFNKNKHRSGYKFKHALMDAKKIYRGVVVEPGRVGPGATKRVATSISKTVGKFADKRIGIRTRRRGSRRGGRR